MNSWLTRDALRWSAVMAIGVSVGACNVQACDSRHVEISSFGVLGEELESDGNPVVLRQSRQIPMQKGQSFGVHFRVAVKSEANEGTDIRLVWQLPIGAEDVPFAGNRVEQTYRVIGNKRTTALYRLEEDWELAEGVWRLEIWNACGKLNELEFVLEEQ